MDFGKVADPGKVDFSLPVDHSDTEGALKRHKSKAKPGHYVGCAKWNKTDLKNFYPRGTKDELGYYAGQFNSIELNATFYRFFPKEQFEKWYQTTPEGFRFFPKVTQDISHFKRLNDFEKLADVYVDAVVHLKEKLGCVFLQLHNNFAPKDFDRVVHFAEYWPKEIPLAIEFRHTNWYNDSSVAGELYSLMEANNIANIITDTAGRRDLLHMRLTNNRAFIRYVGANHPSDYPRLDAWTERLKTWQDQGLKQVNFFVHQNIEMESPLLSAYLIKKMNASLKSNLHVPVTLTDTKQTKLL
ncbi:MAG: DUF72 domain-containing protein [Bacteroidetes bacterium]|nr:DUF72 domain-containing protein [Bacteroidota bacterium]